MASATATLTNQTISHQRLSHPVLPHSVMSSNRSSSPVSPGSESISECYATTSAASNDIWVPREDIVMRNESPQSLISKSQSSSTDTLEATDSPSQFRRNREQMGVSDSLTSSTDTLDENSSPNKSGFICTYTSSPGRSLAHSRTSQGLSNPQPEIETNANQHFDFESTCKDSPDSSRNASGSDSEQTYMTIKRSPKTSQSSANQKPSSEAAVVSSVEEDSSDFMKQLQKRRLTLNSVDKSSLPFWNEKEAENEPSSS